MSHLLRIGLCLLLSSPLVAATREKTTWSGFPAWRLSDGKTEAVVVPALGRVMHYGFIRGRNWLWCPTPSDIAGNPHPFGNWRDWGGNKTWLAPQSQWPAWLGHDWPPDPAWGDARFPHQATELRGGALRLTGPVSPQTGVQIVREFRFNRGAFIIKQIAKKVAGKPLTAALWSVTNIHRPEAAFLLLNPHSPYRNGFVTYAGEGGKPSLERRGDLLIIRPGRGKSYKIGADVTAPSVAALQDGEVFLQRTERQRGQYPDGNPGPGFSVEIYDTGTKLTPRFFELELFTPLRPLTKGSSLTSEVRWSLHRVSGQRGLNLKTNRHTGKSRPQP